MDGDDDFLKFRMILTQVNHSRSNLFIHFTQQKERSHACLLRYLILFLIETFSRARGLRASRATRIFGSDDQRCIDGCLKEDGEQPYGPAGMKRALGQAAQGCLVHGGGST